MDMFKVFAKKLVARFDFSTGLFLALWNVIKEINISITHVYSLLCLFRYRSWQNKKLHLGCGGKIKEGWINIDFHPKADLSLDLHRRLPFPSNSILIIYSEHFLEHLEYPGQVIHFLRESLRVLKPGGVLSVGVPDTEWPLHAYVSGDNRYFDSAKKLWHPDWCVTRLDHINYHFRQGNEHKYAYDFETLKRILELIGFTSVSRRDYDDQIDSEDRKIGTLYVNARKSS